MKHNTRATSSFIDNDLTTLDFKVGDISVRASGGVEWRAR